MDPFMALSLAGTIDQFVDFGNKIITDCKAICVCVCKVYR